MHVKIANEEGSFHDPETGLFLTGSDIKDAGENPGQLTRRYLATKRLVRCEAPTGKLKAPTKTAKPKE